MTSKGKRYLIVNADDFGLTEGINRGIIEAHEDGIVTSASLMVRYPAAESAAIYARQRSLLSVGLHFDVAEWRYRAGNWEAAYQVIDATNADSVKAELEKQLDRFTDLIGRAPTHLDSHQHVHRAEPALSVLLEKTAALKIPLRSFSKEIQHEGNFYGQTGEGEPFPEGVSIARLKGLLANLPVGCTELGCHPGYAENLGSVYRNEREEELRVLCSAEIRAALVENEIELTSFQTFLNKDNAPPVSKAGGA